MEFKCPSKILTLTNGPLAFVKYLDSSGIQVVSDFLTEILLLTTDLFIT